MPPPFARLHSSALEPDGVVLRFVGTDGAIYSATLHPAVLGATVAAIAQEASRLPRSAEAAFQSLTVTGAEILDGSGHPTIALTMGEGLEIALSFDPGSLDAVRALLADLAASAPTSTTRN